MHKHPTMQLPLWSIRNFVSLLMHRYVFVQGDVVNTQDLKEPVRPCPVIFIGSAPGRLHRVFRVLSRLEAGRWICVET